MSHTGNSERMDVDNPKEPGLEEAKTPGATKPPGRSEAGTEPDNSEEERTDDSKHNDANNDEGDEDEDGEDEISDEDEDEEEDDFREPVTDNSQVTFRVRDMNPHLVCRICQGYYREAQTISECLHTFCKSCLLKHFHKGESTCPHCKADLRPNPRNVMVADRTLQEILNKILPDLEEADRRAEKKFYEERGIPLKAEFRVEHSAVPATGPPKKKAKRQQDKEVSVTEAEISFKLERLECEKSTGNLKPLQKPFLRTSGRLKVDQLRKYLRKKLDLKDKRAIEISCKGATLGPELSLHFILRTRWIDADQDLVLHYRKVDVW